MNKTQISMGEVGWPMKSFYFIYLFFEERRWKKVPAYMDMLIWSDYNVSAFGVDEPTISHHLDGQKWPYHWVGETL